MKKKTILEDSNHIYEQLSEDIRYLFNELQQLTKLTDTRLCFAICQLLHDGRICREQENELIYYLKRV